MTRSAIWGFVALLLSIGISMEVNAIMARHHQPPWKAFVVALTLCLGVIGLFAWGIRA